MQLVETIEVGAGGAASIEFTGIADTATDWVILLSARITANDPSAVTRIQINGVTSSTYNNRQLLGSGSAASSTTNSNWEGFRSNYGTNGNSSTANTFSNTLIYIPNYSTSGNAKGASIDAVFENNSSFGGQALTAAVSAVTAPITSVLIDTQGLTFSQYTTASLYTITKAA